MIISVNDRLRAKKLDEQDVLKDFQTQFFFPQQANGQKKIYFNGNSLGLQPKSTMQYIERVMGEWQALGVKGHFQGDQPWIPYHLKLGAQMAPLVGALPNEVVIMNTLTVNLHLMMVSFYRPSGRRYKVLMEADAFPSDRFAVESHLKHHGLDPEKSIIYVPSNPNSDLLEMDEVDSILKSQGEEIALVLFGVPNYYTGQVLDMGKIVKLGHEKGCKVGFNLAHAAGNIPLQLHQDGADFAIWCTYKYMNGGPGNLSGCFIHERHHWDPTVPRFAGWWGQKPEKRFKMRLGFDPSNTADGWCVSNAPILQLAALEAALNIFEEVGMDTLRAKSIQLTDFLEHLLMQLGEDQIRVITPKKVKERGCQLSIQVLKGDPSLYHRLTNAGIVTDWRDPNVIRAAPVPLYNSFQEVFEFVSILEALM